MVVGVVGRVLASTVVGIIVQIVSADVSQGHVEAAADGGVLVGGMVEVR